MASPRRFRLRPENIESTTFHSSFSYYVHVLIAVVLHGNAAHASFSMSCPRNLSARGNVSTAHPAVGGFSSFMLRAIRSHSSTAITRKIRSSFQNYIRKVRMGVIVKLYGNTNSYFLQTIIAYGLSI
jgi:hypothetical protein